MPETDRQRCVIDGLLDASLCDELVFVTKALSTVGYRPGVNSCTIHHLAMMAPYLLVPLVAARQRVWQAVEAAFGLEFELFVEFTGLISWTAGASIGWHHDANRNYLQQRHFSAVVYLNNPDDPPHARCAAADNDFAPAASVPAAGVTTSGSPCAGHLPRPGPPAAGGDGGGFTGGDFEFQSDGDLNPGSSSCLSGAEDGGHCMPAACQGAGGSVSEARSPSLTVRPATGRCVAYAADGRNVHRVCEVLSGERFTLALWFTRDAAFQEDTKVLQALCRSMSRPPPRMPATFWALPPGGADEAPPARPPSASPHQHPATGAGPRRRPTSPAAPYTRPAAALCNAAGTAAPTSSGGGSGGRGVGGQPGAAPPPPTAATGGGSSSTADLSAPGDEGGSGTLRPTASGSPAACRDLRLVRLHHLGCRVAFVTMPGGSRAEQQAAPEAGAGVTDQHAEGRRSSDPGGRALGATPQTCNAGGGSGEAAGSAAHVGPSSGDLGPATAPDAHAAGRLRTTKRRRSGDPADTAAPDGRPASKSAGLRCGGTGDADKGPASPVAGGTEGPAGAAAAAAAAAVAASAPSQAELPLGLPPPPPPLPSVVRPCSAGDGAPSPYEGAVSVLLPRPCGDHLTRPVQQLQPPSPACCVHSAHSAHSTAAAAAMASRPLLSRQPASGDAPLAFPDLTEACLALHFRAWYLQGAAGLGGTGVSDGNPRPSGSTADGSSGGGRRSYDGDALGSSGGSGAGGCDSSPPACPARSPAGCGSLDTARDMRGPLGGTEDAGTGAGWQDALAAYRRRLTHQLEAVEPGWRTLGVLIGP